MAVDAEMLPDLRRHRHHAVGSRVHAYRVTQLDTNALLAVNSACFASIETGLEIVGAAQ